MEALEDRLVLSGFKFVTGDSDGVIYAVEASGNGLLRWYQDTHRDGSPGSFDAANEGNVIATPGWNIFTDVTGDSGFIYAIDPTGNVRWYQDTHRDGSPGSFDAANEGNVIASGWGWDAFSLIFANGPGYIDAIDASFDSSSGVRSTRLKWYRDTRLDGSSGSFGAANEGNAIGTGWVCAPLEGYADAQSVAPGDNLSFYVSTAGSNITVTYLALSGDPNDPQYGIPVSDPEQHPAQERALPPRNAWEGAGWDQDPLHPADFTTTVPSDWQSGLYAARVVDDRGYTLYIPFIVKPNAGQHGRFALIMNTNTLNAYNPWGGRSQYTDPNNGTTLSFLRPNPAATPVKDVSSSNEHFPSDTWLLHWLRQQGYSVDVYSDADFDHGIPGLSSYNAVLLPSHPEYWTWDEYGYLSSYLSQGGNLVYFGGNGIFECVFFSDVSANPRDLRLRLFGADRNPNYFRNFGLPERALLGVAYEGWVGADSTAPYRVTDDGAGSFLLQGTNLHAGDLIGQTGLIGAAAGWELDQTFSPPNDVLGDGGPAPQGTVVLARGIVNSIEADLAYRRTPAGGLVLSAGSLTFVGSLLQDANLQIIVTNALNAVGGPGPAPAPSRSRDRTPTPTPVNETVPVTIGHNLGYTPTATLTVPDPTAALGGAQGQVDGFLVWAEGLGASPSDVREDGAAFGAAGRTTRDGSRLLKVVNRRAAGGVPSNGDDTLRQEATDLFDALNQAGSIG
jgi:hypothetical protein